LIEQQITKASVAPRMPSAVVESEYNDLLNPRHADFGRVIIGKKQRIHFDPRLK